MTTNAPIVINPHLYGKMPFDPLTDLAPVTQLVTLPFVLATHPSVPVKSIRDLIALAKSTPKGLTYGSSGTGGGAHLAGEMMKNMTGVEHHAHPLQGRRAGDHRTPGRRGRLHVHQHSHRHAAAQGRPAAAGRGHEPGAQCRLPNIPSMSEFPALKGAESDLWYGMVVPGKTDRKVIEILWKESARVLALPDFRNRFEPTGAVLVANSPDAFAKLIRARVRPLGQGRESRRHQGGVTLCHCEELRRRR